MSTNSPNNQTVAILLSRRLGRFQRQAGDQVAEVRRTRHVQIVDVLVVEDRVVAHLRDGTGAVLPRLHVEMVSGDVGEPVLILYVSVADATGSDGLTPVVRVSE